MNDIVNFKIVSEKQVGDFISRGWRILEKKADDTYSIGLPIERAYQDVTKIMNQLLSQRFLEEEFQRRAELYGKNLSDYESVPREKIDKYCRDDSYTHVIEFGDEFNYELNQFFELFPDYQENLYATPRKNLKNIDRKRLTRFKLEIYDLYNYLLSSNTLSKDDNLHEIVAEIYGNISPELAEETYSKALLISHK